MPAYKAPYFVTWAELHEVQCSPIIRSDMVHFHESHKGSPVSTFVFLYPVLTCVADAKPGGQSVFMQREELRIDGSSIKPWRQHARHVHLEVLKSNVGDFS
jgi:hypothetical protein